MQYYTKCILLTTRQEQVQRLLNFGADKICLNTSSYVTPELVSEIVKLHGSQCETVSIDVKKVDDGWRCLSHAGKNSTGRDIID